MTAWCPLETASVRPFPGLRDPVLIRHRSRKVRLTDDALNSLLMLLTVSRSGHIPAAILGDLLIVLVVVGAAVVGRQVFKTPLADEAKRALQLGAPARIPVLLLLAVRA